MEITSELDTQWIREKLGIWGNSECVQCGACCYVYTDTGPCKNQEIRDGKSSCLVHEDLEKRKYGIHCEGFFCGNLGDPFIVKNIGKRRRELRDVSVKLGTSL